MATNIKPVTILDEDGKMITTEEWFDQYDLITVVDGVKMVSLPLSDGTINYNTLAHFEAELAQGIVEKYKRMH